MNTHPNLTKYIEEQAAKEQAAKRDKPVNIKGKSDDSTKERVIEALERVDRVTHPDSPHGISRSKFREMSPAERSRFCLHGKLPDEKAKTLTRAEFRALTPQQRLTYIQRGGEIQ